MALLQDLTHKDVEFKWEKKHEMALEQLKNSLTSDEVMAYFDPNKQSVLLVDASPVGLGAMLIQNNKVNCQCQQSTNKCGKALLTD